MTFVHVIFVFVICLYVTFVFVMFAGFGEGLCHSVCCVQLLGPARLHGHGEVLQGLG